MAYDVEAVFAAWKDVAQRARLGRALRRACRASNLTQQELARRITRRLAGEKAAPNQGPTHTEQTGNELQVVQTQVSKWMRGKLTPSKPVLEAMLADERLRLENQLRRALSPGSVWYIECDDVPARSRVYGHRRSMAREAARAGGALAFQGYWLHSATGSGPELLAPLFDDEFRQRDNRLHLRVLLVDSSAPAYRRHVEDLGVSHDEYLKLSKATKDFLATPELGRLARTLNIELDVRWTNRRLPCRVYMLERPSSSGVLTLDDVLYVPYLPVVGQEAEQARRAMPGVRLDPHCNFAARVVESFRSLFNEAKVQHDAA